MGLENIPSPVADSLEVTCGTRELERLLGGTPSVAVGV